MANIIKAYLYLGLITLFFTLIGLAIPLPRWELAHGWPHPTWMYVLHAIYPWSATLFGFLLPVVLGAISFWGADAILLRWCRATRFPNTKYPYVPKIVDHLRQRFKIPYPRLYLIYTEMTNAVSLGLRPSEASLLLTQGLVENSTEEELAGIIAHELSLIKSRQTLLNGIVAVWCGYLLLPAQWALKLPLERVIEDEGPGSNVVATVLYWLATLPFGVVALHLAIGRQRLYDADREAASQCELYRPDETGNPRAFLTALNRVEAGMQGRLCYELIPAVGHLFFVSPFGRRKGVAIYSTHPPVRERWQRVYDLNEEWLKKRLIGVYDERVKERTAPHIKEETPEPPPTEPAEGLYERDGEIPYNKEKRSEDKTLR